jgi:hypothetical protein
MYICDIHEGLCLYICLGLQELACTCQTAGDTVVFGPILADFPLSYSWGAPYVTKVLPTVGSY